MEMENKKGEGYKIIDRRLKLDDLDEVDTSILEKNKEKEKKEALKREEEKSKTKSSKKLGDFDPSQLGGAVAITPEQLVALMTVFPSKDLIFQTLLIFMNKAWQSLGLAPNPATGEVKEDIDGAKILIELSEVLFDKIKRDIPLNFQQEIEQQLMTLRLNFARKSG